MKKLIKLSDTHYIVVDDSEIKQGDFVINHVAPFFNPYQVESAEQLQNVKKAIALQSSGIQKITHSTQPLEDVLPNPIMGKIYKNIKPLSLSEVEEAINGYSVEKMAESHAASWQPELRKSFIKGFKAHQELVKDKLFTVEDIKKALRQGETNEGCTACAKTDDEFIQSLLPKTEWDIEIIDGKIKLI